jgi:hypothetical protein
MKKLLIFIFLVQPFVVFSQTEEVESVTQTVRLYFDGMIQRDRSKLEEAFFKEARLIGYRGDQLFVTPFTEWADGTSEGTRRDSALYKNEVKAVKIVGNIALAEAELFWPGIYYYDFLTLIKMDGKWKIVHKSWTEKPLDF